MTVLPSGPTATELHHRTLLREEEEPRTNDPRADANLAAASSSSSMRSHPWQADCNECTWTTVTTSRSEGEHLLEAHHADAHQGVRGIKGYVTSR